jgi:hypothetical protein
LRSGQRDHFVYSLHLLAWLLIAAAVLWHVAAVLRRGGCTLASSMFLFPVRSNDQPQHWPAQVSRWFRQSF